jgi:hypothetical protein
MSKGRSATTETLNELHRLLTQRLLEDLKRPHYIDPETGREVIPYALYTIIGKFLKDNHIEKDMGKASKDPLGALAMKFKSVVPGDEEAPGIDDDDEDFGSLDDDDIPTV